MNQYFFAKPSDLSLKLLNKFILCVLGFSLSSLMLLNMAIANEGAGQIMPPIYDLLLNDPIQNELTEHFYKKNTGPDKNPMKGWSDGWNRTSQNRTETSVGFQYIPWWRVEPEDDQFDKEAVERILDDHGTVGRHIIIRIQCDWYGVHEYQPGNANSNNGRSRGCPEWIYTDKGVAHIEGEPGQDSDGNPTPPRNVTDYNDPNYIQESVELIAKLAEFYADDPRLYAVELGFLGYWGEWHTFGSNLNPNPPAGSDYTADDVAMYSNSYIIKNSTRQAILDATKRYFPVTQLMGRYPYQAFFETVDDIGYHNDYFLPNNQNSENFENAVAEDERWKQGAIGGEAPPEFNDSLTAADEVFKMPTGVQMIETGHYSTMLLNGTPTDPDHLEGYMTLHRKMGYNYQIDNALFPEQLAQGESFNITLSVDNIGVAPFYYDWKVEYALLNSNNQPVKTVEAVDYDLRDMMPNTTTDINGLIETSNVATGEYQIAVRFIQRGSENNKTEPWKLLARNTYIVFSNDLDVIDGAWNASNALSGGWSVLGNIVIN